MKRAFLWLLAATVAFEGVRAGAGTFRLILDLPAREQIGPVAFAAFSRATDLSAAGVAFYAIYGLGGALLTVPTWLAARRVKASKAIRACTGIAALSSLLVLAFTVPAAPLMWRIGASPDDPVLLAPLIDRFVLWTQLRILLADISFVAVLAALLSAALRPAD